MPSNASPSPPPPPPPSSWFIPAPITAPFVLLWIAFNQKKEFDSIQFDIQSVQKWHEEIKWLLIYRGRDGLGKIHPSVKFRLSWAKTLFCHGSGRGPWLCKTQCASMHPKTPFQIDKIFRLDETANIHSRPKSEFKLKGENVWIFPFPLLSS